MLLCTNQIYWSGDEITEKVLVNTYFVILRASSILILRYCNISITRVHFPSAPNGCWTSSFWITCTIKMLIDQQHSIIPSIKGDVLKYWEKVFLYRTTNKILWYSNSLLILLFLDGKWQLWSSFAKLLIWWNWNAAIDSSVHKWNTVSWVKLPAVGS